MDNEQPTYWWAATNWETDPFPWCVGTGDKIIAWMKHFEHAKLLQETLNGQDHG
jgi:hypothetical protein